MPAAGARPNHDERHFCRNDLPITTPEELPDRERQRVPPLAPAGLPDFSTRSRNGLMMSIGIGKTTVEFCSAPISVSVCR